MCKFLWSVETRTKDSKHACEFLGSLTRLEPTEGELWFACEGTGVSTDGRAHSSLLFCSTDQGVQHVCASYFCSKALICARRTTDCDLESQRNEKVNSLRCARRTTHHGLVSVIPDEKEREKGKERERSTMKIQICNCRNFLDQMCFD